MCKKTGEKIKFPLLSNAWMMIQEDGGRASIPLALGDSSPYVYALLLVYIHTIAPGCYIGRNGRMVE